MLDEVGARLYSRVGFAGHWMSHSWICCRLREALEGLGGLVEVDVEMCLDVAGLNSAESASLPVCTDKKGRLFLLISSFVFSRLLPSRKKNIFLAESKTIIHLVGRTMAGKNKTNASVNG